MKHLYFLSLAMLASPVLAQGSQDESESGQTIVVTGTSLAQTERNLRECLARNCPPDEDIAATLAHAENQFVAGDYAAARRTTKASLARNDRHAERFPVDVSNLYRAGSRIAVHLGEGQDYEQSTWGIKRALKEGVPSTDPQLVGADLEIANMQASMGRIDDARDTYEKAAKNAEKIDRLDLAAQARLRLAWLSQMEGDIGLTRRKLRAIAEDRRPETRVARLSALILLARLDRKEGKAASSSAVIDELRGANLPKPVLLFAPPVSPPGRKIDEGEQGSTTRLMAMQNFDDTWVDVGFWVTSAGRVSDAEILRSSGSTAWAKDLMKSISGRIYSPTSNSDGTYRVERYTFTSLWGDKTGSRIRVRRPEARIEYLDLTAVDTKTRSN
jgi:hypothetical protein